MLSIQIDTKSLELVIYHQLNNIKLSFFASHMKSSFPLCTDIRYSRVCVVEDSNSPLRKAKKYRISAPCVRPALNMTMITTTSESEKTFDFRRCSLMCSDNRTMLLWISLGWHKSAAAMAVAAASTSW